MDCFYYKCCKRAAGAQTLVCLQDLHWLLQRVGKQDHVLAKCMRIAAVRILIMFTAGSIHGGGFEVLKVR